MYKSPGQVWIPAGYLYHFEEESGYQQDSSEASMKSLDCKVSRKSMGTSRKDMNSLPDQDSFEVCRKILGTSRIAGKSLG